MSYLTKIRHDPESPCTYYLYLALSGYPKFSDVVLSTVAYKRFTDNVPLAIDYELAQGLSRDILKVLNTELGIYGPRGHGICADMARESPNIADRRQELVTTLDRLESASKEFDAMAVF
jgi:hypothetical protein